MQHKPLPPVTPEFLDGLRSAAAAAEDSVAKRFVEKLFAKSDKAVSSFFTRLQNGLNKNMPTSRVLNGMEKRLLSDACVEFTDAQIQRLETKRNLNSQELMQLHFAGMRETPLEYQKHYNRRAFLGTSLQLAAIPIGAVAMEGFWHLDEEKRKKEEKKSGRPRSEFYDGYCKLLARGKGVLVGVLALLIGDRVKVLGPTPSTIWESRGRELMDGLNDMLVAHQALQTLENEQGKTL